MRKIFF